MQSAVASVKGCDYLHAGIADIDLEAYFDLSVTCAGRPSQGSVRAAFTPGIRINLSASS